MSLQETTSPPYITIVIATFARPQQLKKCLQALTQIQYPKGFWDVIVVDDGSPVQLDGIVAQFVDQIDVQLLRQSNAGAASARNLGASRAKGELIAFTDDDCCPLPDWLDCLAASYLQDKTAAIGGQTINALATNPCATASHLLIDYLYDYFHPNHSDRFFATNNAAFPKAVFDSIDGFDERFPRAGAEDRDLCRRWIDAGNSTILCPEAAVLHEHFMGTREFLRQHFNYGRGAYHFHKHKAYDRHDDELRVEPFKFYSALIMYPFSRKTQINPIVTSMFMFLSQAANCFGFFYERYRPDQRAAENFASKQQRCESNKVQQPSLIAGSSSQ